MTSPETEPARWGRGVPDKDRAEWTELRDRFAIGALQGMLASDGAKELESDYAAALAYEFADAMLLARIQPGSDE